MISPVGLPLPRADGWVMSLVFPGPPLARVVFEMVSAKVKPLIVSPFSGVPRATSLKVTLGGPKLAGGTAIRPAWTTVQRSRAEAVIIDVMTHLTSRQFFMIVNLCFQHCRPEFPFWISRPHSV